MSNCFIGVPNNLDGFVTVSVCFFGSENTQVSIGGIPNYEKPQGFVEEELKLINDDEDKDEDANENDESDKFDLLTDQEITLVIDQ